MVSLQNELWGGPPWNFTLEGPGIQAQGIPGPQGPPSTSFLLSALRPWEGYGLRPSHSMVVTLAPGRVVST